MARNVRMRATQPRILDWYHMKNGKGVVAVNSFSKETEAWIQICDDGSFELHFPGKNVERFTCCEIESVMIKVEKEFD